MDYNTNQYPGNPGQNDPRMPQMPVSPVPAMGFMEAVQSCFQKYVQFSGRATRAEFWWFILFTIVVGNVLSFISSYLGMVAQIAFLLPTIAVWSRRMHDVGKGAGWMFCPIYNIVLAATASELYDNRFGAVPPTAY